MNTASVFRISQSKEGDQKLTGKSQQSGAFMPNLVKNGRVMKVREVKDNFSKKTRSEPSFR